MSIPLLSVCAALLGTAVNLFGIVPAAFNDRFGSQRAVLQATPAELQEVPHVGPKLAGALCQAFHDRSVEAEWERLARHPVRVVALGTPEYPAARYRPSGLYVTDETDAETAGYGWSNRPVRASQTRTTLPAQPVARRRPSGLYAAPITECL